MKKLILLSLAMSLCLSSPLFAQKENLLQAANSPPGLQGKGGASFPPGLKNQGKTPLGWERGEKRGWDRDRGIYRHPKKRTHPHKKLNPRHHPSMIQD